MYAIRLGLIGVLLLHLTGRYNVKELLIYLIKLILIMSVIIYFASFLKIENHDYYQLFDNLNTPLAQLTILFCMIVVFNNFQFKPKILFPILIVPSLLLMNFLKNKNIEIHPKNDTISHILNQNNFSKTNLYVISDTINPNEYVYFTKPYMLISNKYIPWYTKNLKIVNGIQLYPARNLKDSNFNEANRHTIHLLKDTKYIKKQNIGNIVFQ
jgi:hypothetical protein